MPHLYPRYIPTISLRPHLSLLSHYFLSASIVGLFSATLSFSFSAPQLTEPLFLFSSTSFLSHSSLLSLPLPLSLSPPTIFSLHALLLFSSLPLFPLYHLPPLFFNRPPPPMHVSTTIFFYSICPPPTQPSLSHIISHYIPPCLSLIRSFISLSLISRIPWLFLSLSSPSLLSSSHSPLSHFPHIFFLTICIPQNAW